ncbi:MAG: aminopeptidase P family protein [Clostridia bacterium]|nr:aminopeptidase P family protein [Clostridia bacterium]
MSHLTKLQSALKEKNADAVIVSSEINQRYLTSFAYTDGYVLVTQEKGYLITDFRYIEAAQQECAEGFDILMPKGVMILAMREIVGDNKTVLFEEATLPVSDKERIERIFDTCTLTSGGSEVLDGLRLYKDAEEIEKMKKAQAITDAGFRHMLDVLTPDMTELEAALELEFFMRKMGSEGTAFETIAVSGSASSLPHGVPRNKKLEKGFFTMDFGARIDGYCSDMTRTVVLGKADDEMKRLYNTVLTAQTTALDALKVGMRCRDADKIARDIIYGAGYEGCFGHSLGHGVGLYIHEAPRLSFASPENVLLSPGHVVTVEPGIYIAGKYGCRIEDMVAVLEDGTIYDFTQSPKEMIELF